MSVSHSFFCPTGTLITIDTLGGSYTDIANIFTGRLKSIQLSPLEGEAVETTHGGTTPQSSGKIIRTYEGGCLVGFQAGSVTVYMDKNIDYQNMVGVNFNFKVTFPLLSGESTATIWNWEGVLLSYQPQNFDLLANGKAEAVWRFQPSGAIAETAAT